MINKGRLNKASIYVLNRWLCAAPYSSGRNYWRGLYKGISKKYYSYLEGETV